MFVPPSQRKRRKILSYPPPTLSSHGNSCYISTAAQLVMVIADFCDDPTLWPAWLSTLRSEGGNPVPSYNECCKIKSPTARHVGAQEDVGLAVQVFLECAPRLEALAKGSTVHKVVCAAKGHLSSRTEPFVVLRLPISDQSTLEACLEKFYEPSVMTDFECTKCGGKRGDGKGMTLFSALPSMFVIFHLGRGVGASVKDERRIEFPYESSDSGLVLRAVIYHHGSALGGHYTIDRQTRDGRWWHCDDSGGQKAPLVTQVPGVTKPKEAVILLYHKAK